MSLHPRPALVFFDSRYRITQIDEVARQLLGPDSASRIGQPLTTALHGIEAGLDEILQAGGAEAGRYLSGSTTLAGQAWRVEFVMLPHDCGGVLMIRQDTERAGVAKLLHDLRTPLNAMVGWLHLLGSHDTRAVNHHARATAGLRRAVDQQRRLLDDWSETAEPAHATAGPVDGDALGPAPAAGGAPLTVALGISPDAAVDDDPTGSGSAPDTGPLNGVFVLAVDDNREMLRALESLLGRCGAVVETATSADDALLRYSSWAAGGGERLLVTDLAMPKRDGLSLVKEIRKLERLHRLPRLPAIALSAHARPEMRREAFASGFDLFLAKPVDPPVLLGHLRNMLDR